MTRAPVGEAPDRNPTVDAPADGETGAGNVTAGSETESEVGTEIGAGTVFEPNAGPGPSAESEHAADPYAPWWRAVRRWARTLAGREAVLLLVAAAVVQLVMPYRYDLPCHVLGGGAASLLLAAGLPGRAVRRLGPWTDAVVFVALCVTGWVVEHVVYGPFDLVDLAFTYGGAFVVSDASGRVATSSTAARLRVVAVAVPLLVLAAAYHYLMGLGAA